MEMKIKNSIFENSQYFITFTKIHSADQLSVMDAFRINRLAKKLNVLHEEFAELKKGLLERFGTEIEEDDQTTRVENNQTASKYKIEDDTKEEFMKEMNFLWAIEHDLEIKKLPFPNNIKDGISAADMGIVELFFDLSTLEKSSKKLPK